MSKYNACQTNIANKYKHFKVKVFNTIQNIKFNQKYLKNWLIPNYIYIKVNNNSLMTKKVKHKAKIIWLKNEIRLRSLHEHIGRVPDL